MHLYQIIFAWQSKHLIIFPNSLPFLSDRLQKNTGYMLQTKFSACTHAMAETNSDYLQMQTRCHAKGIIHNWKMWCGKLLLSPSLYAFICSWISYKEKTQQQQQTTKTQPTNNHTQRNKHVHCTSEPGNIPSHSLTTGKTIR